MTLKRPELLSPAGDMERLHMALHYGADAVYLAGTQFGMRASAGNFNPEQLRNASKMIHERNKKMYVTCNTIPHENELENLPEFLELIENCGADGIIAADLGVFAMIKKYAPKTPLHASTQMGVINSAAACMLHDMGASRVVLARETTMEEIRQIRAKIPKELEIEAFVHGAMCVSFSGRCLLSNYMTDRDANRGACAQPCRWKYYIAEEKRKAEPLEIFEDTEGTYILNSRDMCMIEHVPELIEAGVDSFKIEGRMKSFYYAAAATYAYRNAIDIALEGRELPEIWKQEVQKISHRQYSTGFYFGYPGQYLKDAMYFFDAEVCAIVEEKAENGLYKLTQRTKFATGDKLEIITPNREPIEFIAEEIFSKDMKLMENMPHPMMEFFMKLPESAERFSIVRKLTKK